VEVVNIFPVPKQNVSLSGQWHGNHRLHFRGLHFFYVPLQNIIETNEARSQNFFNPPSIKKLLPRIFLLGIEWYRHAIIRIMAILIINLLNVSSII